MKWTTSGASAASNEPSAQGRFSAAASRTSASGHAPAGLDERGRIDGGDRRRAEPLGELLRQDPGAAADVEHGLPRLDAGPVDEHRREHRRVAAHEPVVASPETSKVIRGIHVRDQRRVKLEPHRLELVESLAKREPAVREAALEDGKGAPRVGTGQRPGLGDSGVRARIAQLEQKRARDERRSTGRTTHTSWSRRAGRRRAPPWRRGSRPVVEERERELEPVRDLADGEPLLARLAERPPGAVGEGLSLPLRERLRRAEAPARAADEQDARQVRTRHGSL